MAGVTNGTFENAPAFVAAQTTVGKWINGTATGAAAVQPYGWYLGGMSGSGSTQFDTAQAHSGVYSLKLSTLATASQIVDVNAQNVTTGFAIPVVWATSYTLSFWMMTVVNSGAAATGAFLQVAEYTSGNSNTFFHNIGNIPNSTSWTQYTYTWKTNPATSYLEIKPYIIGSNGTGTLIMDAWFDDMVLSGGPVNFVTAPMVMVA